jgi:tRNA threonylcarbamoyladenosine biosynthesis protein TsaE
MAGTLPRRAAEASERLRRHRGVAQIAGMTDIDPPDPGPVLLRELPDLAATGALAAELAALARPGDLILLDGPFGAGKTAFARAFLRAASGDPALEVPSPSFTLVQSYDTRRGRVHHFDLWRLDGPAALAELGWDEALADIVLAEWPARLGALRPPGALEVQLRLLPGEARQARLSGWPDRLAPGRRGGRR